MYQVSSPFQLFCDTSGAPINNGKIYIGAVGQNPVTNPITVYWDEAGTTPVAQPVLVSGGVPTRQGTPARLYISAEDYALSLYDKKGGLVYFASSVTSISTLRADLATTNGSAFVGFKQAGAGAVDRTVQAKIRECVSILDFGGDPTGVTLSNMALDKAKAVCPTVYLPPGTYRLENYNLQDLRLIGAGTDGANYGNFTTIIEGSGDIFVGANNFSLEHLTIRNSASGAAGKLIAVKDIDTSIGPITNCNFLRANYHIYHQSATNTIVGAAITGCLFREALIYSRYYANQGLFQYSETDCYTQLNKRGLFIQSTSTALFSASVFEFHDEGAIYVENTAVFSDVIRGLKFQNIHFEQNGNTTPSPDVTIKLTSLARVEFDSCGIYSPTAAGNVDCTGSLDLRIFEHNCSNFSYQVSPGTKLVVVHPKAVGETNALKITGQDIQLDGGAFVTNAGLQSRNSIYSRIFATDTTTVVQAPSSIRATLVLVRDATTSGVAVLMMTDSAVTVVSSTLFLITFSVVGGFLTAKTTGGSSFRDLYFNCIST